MRIIFGGAKRSPREAAAHHRDTSGGGEIDPSGSEQAVVEELQETPATRGSDSQLPSPRVDDPVQAEFMQVIAERLREAEDTQQVVHVIADEAHAVVAAFVDRAGRRPLSPETQEALTRHILRAALDREGFYLRPPYTTDIYADELADYVNSRYRYTTLPARTRYGRLAVPLLVALLLPAILIAVYISVSPSLVTMAFALLGVVASLVILWAWYAAAGAYFAGVDFAEEWATAIIPLALIAGGFGFLYWFTGNKLADLSPSHESLLHASHALATGALLAPVAIMVLAAVYLCLSIVLRSVIAPNPYLRYRVDSGVVVSLAESLLLSSQNDFWMTFEKKEPVIKRLELCARMIEQGMPDAIRPRDVETSDWLRGRAQEIASGIRILKRDVCSPGRHTRSRFEAKLYRFVASAALGNWDEFAANASPLGERPGRVKRIWLIVRPLVAGLAPLITALLLVQQGVLADPVAGPVLLFAGSLAFIVLLGLIDPDVLAKLSSAKEVASSITPTVPQASKKP